MSIDDHDLRDAAAAWADEQDAASEGFAAADSGFDTAQIAGRGAGSLDLEQEIAARHHGRRADEPAVARDVLAIREMVQTVSGEVSRLGAEYAAVTERLDQVVAVAMGGATATQADELDRRVQATVNHLQGIRARLDEAGVGGAQPVGASPTPDFGPVLEAIRKEVGTLREQMADASAGKPQAVEAATSRRRPVSFWVAGALALGLAWSTLSRGDRLPSSANAWGWAAHVWGDNSGQITSCIKHALDTRTPTDCTITINPR